MSPVTAGTSLRENASGAFEIEGSVARKLAQLPVLAFACFVALLVLLAAYFTDRNGDVDELAMYNPSYMVAHFGKLTFPTYPWGVYFNDPVVIHPPVHLGFIGLLSRLGFTWYYAEATPTVLFFFVAIAVIVGGAFPAPVKLSLLFSIGFVTLTGEKFAACFGTRPEGELHAAWFAGLLLLESGRLARWSRARLGVGAFLLTWASGVHYNAAPAFLGVGVYMVWAVRDLGWKEARPRILALCAGSCLFGIPYTGLFLAPYSRKILTAIQMTQGSGFVAASVRAHLDLYRTWSQQDYIPALVRKPFGFGIPLIVFSTAALSLVRSTRGIALAALPLQLFIFLFATHKQPGYLLHEIALFAAAACLGVLVLGDWLCRYSAPRFQGAFVPVAAALLVFYLVTGNPTLQAAVAEPHVQEAELARSAGRLILGPHARVTGRYGAWYSSGAEHWYDIERDMLRAWPYDPSSYFDNFDAVADYAHMSGYTYNSTISSFYAAGALKLRGFYMGEKNEQLQIVLLSPKPAKVVGFAAKNGQLYRFEEFPNGNHEVLSAVCPAIPELRDNNWSNRWTGAFSVVLHLPDSTQGAPVVVVTVLTPRDSREPSGWIGRSCKEIARLPGSLSLADKKDLIELLRRDDTPMHFYRNLEQMPGYRGVGLPNAMTPPKNGVRLGRVLSLPGIRAISGKAHVDRIPQILVTTRPEIGGFSASIPVTHSGSVVTPCWIQLRLKVITGRVGFAAYSQQTGILSCTLADVLKSSEPMDVALLVPNLRDVTDIIIFNDGEPAAQVEVLDATILVTQEDWERNKAALSSVR